MVGNSRGLVDSYDLSRITFTTVLKVLVLFCYNILDEFYQIHLEPYVIVM